jgi:hypothetical protein
MCISSRHGYDHNTFNPLSARRAVRALTRPGGFAPSAFARSPVGPRSGETSPKPRLWRA